ncbi:SDR family NAD(P)-dependent oxidoreductase [Ferrimicrobium acidiphilum]|jgi:NAD(P)-dependent dehydrogenase (short-subunit alcohol dehydrogenase family)|uniref:3-oxoacyl-[acyl-carrier-protein] reductase FabG n=1 Tax=Ferrimicrobium acidiphilum DSM 19497 TaxID=1121877 RepID=A0A0D8FXX1_9ACTN|nr:SDR family NAD(P)-dependent oxidoreductase [Ferrimicrobium acidiphilum]KJE78118.1 3-oxoacyl-[acyl-carrier-protein] reductase FabG [Ferrimicrobium acidiphilum DSM 19497]MCL5054273.1 SDR family NAD(P)-dependent oxidoreductase [Gammaproteobacteria bacterium]
MNIQGDVAVISGGASGLGLATARALVDVGVRVVLADRNEEAGGEASKNLGEFARFVSTDVVDETSVSNLMAEASEFGVIRMVVSCAGIGIAERTIDRGGKPHDLSSFERVINVNLFGTFNMLRYGASYLSKNDPRDGQRGLIVNTASIAAYDGQIGQLAYSASKGGIVGLTLPAARDLSSAGIRVVTVAPGIMDTPLLGTLPEDVKSALDASVPFPKRLGLPSDFAKLVLSILDNDYLNGEVIRLDGALRMPPR